MMFSRACILTRDFHDFTLDFFDRLNFLTRENLFTGQLTHYQLLSFSQEKFTRANTALSKAQFSQHK